MLMALTVLLPLFTCGGAQAQRDAALPRPVPAATIRGRVTSAATGLPLHRVRLTLSGSLANPLTTVTDTKGMFELTDVPPGSYSLTATRAGYLAIQYGQRRPRQAGRTIHVESAQTIEGIDFALYRGGVIAGRLSDEQGEPTPGARIEATELRYIQGRRVHVAARIATANDAGEFRLSGLQPGAYQLRASSTDIWEGDDGKTSYVFATTSFPGVTGPEQPQSINVAVGQEVAGIELRLIPGRAARIFGVLEDAAGNPMAARVVNLDRITRTIGGALSSAGFGGSTRTDARGAFEFPKLAPGEYVAYAGGPNETASVTVVVEHGERRDIVLTPRRPAAVAGLVVTDTGTAPPFTPARIRVLPVAVDAARLVPEWGAARAQPPKSDWSFRITGVDGRYLFRVVDLPDDWILKRVTAGGGDVTDTPLAIARGGPDLEDLRIVLSKNGARVTGEVIDANGASVADATVVLFPEDSAHWGTASRYIRATTPDPSGRFSLSGLLPGVYRLFAREDVVDGQWEDPEFLRSALKDAARMELSEGATETTKVMLGRGR
jgi:hypothetical protein